MKKFKHSGTFGDLIYSLAITRHFGGGEYYLHLNQINWIGQHYYGSQPAAFHQGRMTQQDFEFMQSFMEAQSYITKFSVLTPDVEITHNLDRFRPAFVGHPGNYLDIYSSTFNISDPATQAMIRKTPWIDVPAVTAVPGRDVVVNRTARWLPPTLNQQWDQWRDEGLDQRAVFVGLPEEYDQFVKDTGWTAAIYHPTPRLLDLAQVVAGASMFIGNQSQALALAVGLGVPYWCELRRDLPVERNECFFPEQPRGNYF